MTVKRFLDTFALDPNGFSIAGKNGYTRLVSMSLFPRKFQKNALKKNKVKSKYFPKKSQLITIKNYKKFYPPKLPSETLSSTQLNFVTAGNEV